MDVLWELHEFYDKNLIKYNTISHILRQIMDRLRYTNKVLVKLDEGDVELQVQRLLFSQHTAVYAGIEKTTAELLMGKKLRTVFDKLHPYALK